MAKEIPPPEEKKAAPEPVAKKGVPLKKLLIIGVPVFLVQLAVLFFVASKYLSGAPSTASAATTEAGSHHDNPEAEGEQAVQHMFVVKDMIVNPAGTNGSRFLLVTIGFESSSAEGVKELERKEIQLRDILNTVLTAKSLDELASVGQREELRTEIQARSGELVKVGSVTNVYFSKFIIQ
jgi:flagellar FliL protein